MAIHWTIIHNPRSCSGKGAKVWPQAELLLKQAGISYTVHPTTYAGHAVELTRAALREGERYLVAMGGDGTVNEVINGIFGQTEVPPKDVLLTQWPIGTGNDWRRTLGMPKRPAEIIALLQAPGERWQDVGVVDFVENSLPKRKYFGNVAGMGFEAYVGVKANAQKAAGKGGPLGYYPILISSLAKYEAVEASFEIDGRLLSSRKFFTLALGVCCYNGGGMKQCPNAVIDDGLLDLTLINEVPKLVVAMNVPRLFNGSFVKIKYVEQHRGKVIKVITGPGTLIEIDGEDLGQGEALFTIMPKALRVAVPKD